MAIVISLSHLGRVNSLVLLVDPEGYTTESAPSIEITGGVYLDNMNKLRDTWKLGEARGSLECENTTCFVHHLSAPAEIRFLQLRVSLPSSGT